MKPDERGRHPERVRGLLHRFDEHLAHQRHQHSHARQRGQCQANRPRRLASLAMLRAAKELAMGLEREHHAQSVRDDEQQRQPTLNFCVNAPALPGVGLRDRRRNQQRDRARKSRPACKRALTRLYSCTWYLSPPRRNDAPSMNSVLVTIAPAMDAFTSMYCPARNAVSAMTSSVRLPKRGVEQTADGIARLGRHRLGGMTEQRRQRHDRQDRQHETAACAPRASSVCRGEHRGHEDQQPEQRIVTDFF